MSPLVAELEPPIPMIVYISACTLLFFLSFFLKRSKDAEAALRELDEVISLSSSMVFSVEDGVEETDKF